MEDGRGWRQDFWEVVGAEGGREGEVVRSWSFNVLSEAARSESQ